MKDLTPDRKSLDPIEIASRDEIEALQLQRMQWSLRHAYDNVPFYRKSFDEKGVHPGDLKSLKDLSKFPFTLKTDLRDHYPFGMFAVPREQVRADPQRRLHPAGNEDPAGKQQNRQRNGNKLPRLKPAVAVLVVMVAVLAALAAVRLQPVRNGADAALGAVVLPGRALRPASGRFRIPSADAVLRVQPAIFAFPAGPKIIAAHPFVPFRIPPLPEGASPYRRFRYR